jgi:hypothetical protein
MLVGCGVAAFGGVWHWMVNNGSALHAEHKFLCVQVRDIHIAD